MINYSIIREILKTQVKPALGCTEPGAVALAVAKAKEILGKEVENLHITVNNNILKNGLSVGIPGTKDVGLDFAAALALCVGKSEYGLEVFKDVTDKSVIEAKEILAKHIIKVELDKSLTSLYIGVEAKAGDDIAKVIIKDAHTNFIFESLNDKIILDNDSSGKSDSIQKLENKEIKYKIMDYDIDQLIEYVNTEDINELLFIQDGINMNLTLAEVGLNVDLGIGISKHYKKNIINTSTKAKAYTVAASEARMSGYPLPVMSSAGSGNHGLVAIVPIAIVGKDKEYTNEQIIRAVALSHLITIFVKVQLGALSPVCGCGVAAGLGSAAGMTYLQGGTNNAIKAAINNMIAGISGMFCDGAKIGCSYKLSIAVDAALDAAGMALDNIEIPSDNGILGDTAEESIANLALVSNLGMNNTDAVILDIMMHECP
ncbi:MAG: L-serine ammonia-lyase, iron-sulfur-dependent, subunit alpha [Gudongella sp.]|nr:L-serine ammonia-lyase, iron-sulfur-dependent, subunit alpha [Gudongella sp.]